MNAKALTFLWVFVFAVSLGLSALLPEMGLLGHAILSGLAAGVGALIGDRLFGQAR